jgi:hypothetical protein
MLSKIGSLLFSLSLFILVADTVFLTSLSWGQENSLQHLVDIVMLSAGTWGLLTCFLVVRAVDSLSKPIQVTPARREQILRMMNWN